MNPRHYYLIMKGHDKLHPTEARTLYEGREDATCKPNPGDVLWGWFVVEECTEMTPELFFIFIQ